MAVKLTTDAVKRIAKQTRKAEKTPIDLRGQRRANIAPASNKAVSVRVSSSTGVGGKYQGYIQKGTATDSDLTGFTDSTDACIVVNGAEKGETYGTPLIQNYSAIFPGIIVGTDTASGMQIVLIGGFSDTMCS